MERDRDVLGFARAALHGDEEHQAWLLDAASAWIDGRPLPAVAGGSRARAEALEEVAKLLDARQRHCAEAANQRSLSEAAQHVWSELADENRDGARIIRSLIRRP